MSIQGYVEDASGQPSSNCKLFMYRRSDGTLLGSAVSDDSGNYELTHTAQDGEKVFIVCLDNDDAPDFEGLVHDRITIKENQPMLNPPHDLTFDLATGLFTCSVDKTFTIVAYHVICDGEVIVAEGQTSNSGDGMMCSATITTALVPGRSYIIDAWVIDNNGNARSGSASLNFTVDNNPEIEPVYPASAMVLRSSDQVSEVFLGLGDGTYNIDWGDGTTTKDGVGDIVHNYGSLAKHTIIIERAFLQPGFPDAMIMRKALGVQEVVQWYANGYRDLKFSDSNDWQRKNVLTKVPTIAPLLLTNPIELFSYCTLFNDPSILQWDMSQYTDLSGMFYECYAFNQPIGTWDFSNKTNLTSMFYNCTSFNQDMGMINVANVTEMSMMFRGCTQFDQDLSQWCVPTVTPNNGVDGDFARWSSLKPEHYPVWGTCPA